MTTSDRQRPEIHADPAISWRTSGSDVAEARTGDCTQCTQDEGVGVRDGEGIGCDPALRLPEPEPALFLLAGVSVASACPGGARAVRARAELQAALAESSRPGQRGH